MLRQASHRLALEGGVPWVGQVRSPPERLFPGRVGHLPARLERLVFATVVEGATALRTIEAGEVVERMLASQLAERRPLLAAYERFRFAFPSRRNPLLENATDEEERLLRQAFADVPARELRHPYPVAPRELYDAAQAFLA